MYWGNLLLDAWFGNIINTIKVGIYNIGMFFPRQLYAIWKLIALLVSNIEGIFRNLAGLETKSGGDMVSQIINDGKVGQVFTNLVSLSTALIIFFTIVKIIQEHYKDKDGGNPYKILLRTFKGLLMFFFIQGAVVVGLYATGVMFRALDASTGTGAASISGMIFKNMASDANRLLIGDEGDDEDVDTGDDKNGENGKREVFTVNGMYFNRLWTGSDTYGKYYIAEIKNDTSLDRGENSGSNSGNSNSGNDPWTPVKDRSVTTAERYAQLFPSSQYEVVDANGNVKTMSQWLGTLDDSNISNVHDSGVWDGMDDQFGKYFGEVGSDFIGTETHDLDKQTALDENHLGGSAGWQSDFLSGVDLRIQPTLNLAWSPIDIQNYEYKLLQYGDTVDFSKNILIHGTGIELHMGTEYAKYYGGLVGEKSIEESAKSFGFTAKGTVAFQSGNASASFSLNKFNTSQFEQILQSVIGNVIYTNVLETIVLAIPVFPSRTHIGPITISWVKTLSPIINNAIKIIVDRMMINGGMVPVDENGNPLVTVIVVDGSARTSNAGVWSTVNTKSEACEITFERYKVDGNFTDLWGQLTANIDTFKHQLEATYSSCLQRASQQVDAMKDLQNRVQGQEEWRAYQCRVNEYNEKAIPLLNELANLIHLHDLADAVVDKQAELDRYSFNGNMDDLERLIKSDFISIVGNYNGYIRNNPKPSSSYADASITRPLYKPVIQFDVTDDFADSATLTQIRKVLLNSKVNLLIHQGGAYKLLDWASYGPHYLTDYENVADIYTDSPGDDVYQNNTLGSLKVMNLDHVTTGSWENFGGIDYFTGLNENNGFKNLSNKTLLDSSYWSIYGIHMNGAAQNPVYYYYDGTDFDPHRQAAYYLGKASQDAGIDDVLFGDRSNITGLTTVKPKSVVRSSSAQSNQVVAAKNVESNAQIKALTTANADSEEINAFAQNIVTFRKINPADGTVAEEKRALKDWCNNTEVLGFNSTNVKQIWELSGEQGKDTNGNAGKSLELGVEKQIMVANMIDEYMTKSDQDSRRYLLLSHNRAKLEKAQVTNPIVEQNDGSTKFNGKYVGRLSWTNGSAVNALYNYARMNYLVGYIAIVATLGVYMNFVFGLIQRAVNMVVLYMMSPLTIAFYPFDDGSKFNNNFVKPFYQEAISAFAVIISLNVFIILIDPVQDAVAAVTGNYFLGWLGLVAFVSMLPNIRTSVAGFMGAKDMQQKSLTDTFKAAGSALSTPFKDLKGLNDIRKRNSVSKGIAHARDKMRSWKNKIEATKTDRQQSHKDFLSKIKNSGGGLSAWATKRLDKINGKESAAKKLQNDIDNARATGDTSKLTSRGKRLMRQQEKAAKVAAKSEVKLSNYDSLPEYEAALKQKQNEYLNNDNFKKSVNGVAAAKHFKWQARGANIRNAVSNTGLAQGMAWMADMAKNTGVAEVWRSKYGLHGTESQDKDSWWGARQRARNYAQNAKEQQEYGAKVRDQKRDKYENPTKNVWEGFLESEQALRAANDLRDKTIRQIASKGKLENLAVDKKYRETKIAELMENDPKLSRKDAEKKVNEDIKEELKKYIVDNSSKKSAKDNYTELLTAQYIQAGMSEKAARRKALADVKTESQNAVNNFNNGLDAKEKCIQMKAEEYVKNQGMSEADARKLAKKDVENQERTLAQKIESLKYKEYIDSGYTHAQAEAYAKTVIPSILASGGTLEAEYNKMTNNEGDKAYYRDFVNNQKYSKFKPAAATFVNKKEKEKFYEGLYNNQFGGDNEYNKIAAETQNNYVQTYFEQKYNANNDWDQLAKNDNVQKSFMSQFVNEAYVKSGGDDALVQGIMNGRIGLGVDFKIDTADIDAATKKLDEMCNKGADKLQEDIDKLNNNRNINMNTTAKELAKEIGREGDAETIEFIKNKLENASSNTTLDSITEEICKNYRDVDKNKVEKAVEIQKKNIEKSINDNIDLSNLSNAKQIINLDKDVYQKFISKAGTMVNAAEAYELKRDYNNVYDTNLNSTNPESFGYRKNKIIQSYGGNADDPACIREVNALKEQMENLFTQHLQSFVDRNERALREHDVHKKHKDEMDAIFKRPIVESLQEGREKILDTMDPSVFQVIVKDEHRQDMVRDGNYAGAGQEFLALVDALKKNDKEAVARINLDETTKTTIGTWIKDGGAQNEARIKSLCTLSNFDAEHMGSMLTSMSGASIANAQAVLAHLTAMVENKIVTQKIDQAIGAYGSQESHSRAMVDDIINGMQGMFGGTEWKDYLKGIKDENGKLVSNTTELIQALQSSLRKVNADSINANDENVKNNRAILAQFKAQYANDPRYVTMINTIDRYEQGISAALSANECSDKTNVAFGTKMDILARQRESERKLKEYMAGSGK